MIQPDAGVEGLAAGHPLGQRPLGALVIADPVAVGQVKGDAVGHRDVAQIDLDLVGHGVHGVVRDLHKEFLTVHLAHVEHEGALLAGLGVGIAARLRLALLPMEVMTTVSVPVSEASRLS